MPRGKDTKQFVFTMTPEQHRVFLALTGDKSKLLRQLIRVYLAEQGIVFPPDAPAPIETARKTRWKKKQQDS